MFKTSIVLAAGQGTRMKSKLPKVLHKVCGKEIINHIIDTLKSAKINEVNLVIGNEAETVEKETASRDVKYYMQQERLGTGHAVMCAKEALEGKSGCVVVLAGDAPLVTDTMLEEVMSYHEENKFAVTVITSVIDNPAQYGRIIRDKQGNLDKIVEFKDCNEEQKKVNEVNSAMYCFDIDLLRDNIDKLSNENAQNEYYLTDMIEILKGQGERVGAFVVPFENTLGVNSRTDLAKVELTMRKRINEKHMTDGVTLIDPNNVYIDSEVEIANDCIIYPGNVIQGNTKIGEGCVIYPNSRIENSVLKEDVVVQNSVIIDSEVGENTTIGPFAYLRPESVIGKDVKIGDFVEVKKSTIGDGTKVSHLTYIGDAEVGEKCNFGCGTVVVNYDGTHKHKTVVEDEVFVGCNTNLVSPVTVKKGAYIAAGSTITEDVPEKALSIARSRQVNKENWTRK